MMLRLRLLKPVRMLRSFFGEGVVRAESTLGLAMAHVIFIPRVSPLGRAVSG